MNRPIKFMAWNRITKTTVDLYKITPLALSVEQDGLFIPFMPELDLYQFTGLLDKEGKEIFEGHILRVGNFYIGDTLVQGGEGPVVYRNGCFMVDIKMPIELCAEEIHNCKMVILGHIAEGGKNEKT